MSGARHSAFHRLRVTATERLTDDAVAITFAVPPDLRSLYRYTPGQHITLRRFTGNTEIRRTYSICSPALDADGPTSLRVGVRLVEGGEFSTYALKELVAGDEVEVMAPAGRFVLDVGPAPQTESAEDSPDTDAVEDQDGAQRTSDRVTDGGHYAAIVGGSGITPVLSIVATLLARRPTARFCLIRSDRSAASTMFLEEVADLKDRYPDRLQLVHALSREEQQVGLPSGRLDRERLTDLLPALVPVADVDGWFLCGPYGLVRAADAALSELGVPRARVHQEIFHVADDSLPTTSSVAPAHSTVTATLDGRSGTWPAGGTESLLETVLRNRADAPYACKGGVCGTCRAFLVSGEVHMDRNFALEAEELDAGYVLACQSHPVSEQVELDFDR
ncbi:2Fe-2S iron-sulfur cluster binding domain-containing protein [Streptomyces sp. AC536]|uniref:2Fe-2S iron-sulfur cluster-binding protein n=1 Tax=Streptomyces buecherae TaxID=2763006 RepID=UPI00164E41CF|nr:2Fe-2S iron-sulfur cluster-binding protein [Streptomyces buecherae]MBC3984963.1 2Fe-2S iron-sulfur cluster binding domain-containing protein [Streptomyces buecherae]QNJ41152.1 2Fe-2S iron-sulfur cluster binding domain-containing protein [Streptomyces buecherae]